VATSVIFGSAAALHVRFDVSGGLKESSGRVDGRRQFLRNALIAAQVAFSYVLLTGAGLMVHSFLKLERVDPGFVPQHVIAMSFDLNWSKYQGDDGKKALSFSNRLLEKLRDQPGVLSVAVSSGFPLDPDTSMGAGWADRMRVEGENRAESEAAPVNQMRTATPDYFRTLGIPLLSGRVFTDADNEHSLPVAIISRSLAQRRWRGRDPLGHRLSFDRGEHWLTVVGVVGDVKEFGLDRGPAEQLYQPMAQNTALGAVLVRTSGDAASIARQAHRAILDIDPETAIPYTQTLEQRREDSVASPRSTARLVGGFAALAFVIAVAGIGFILALWVKQRTREIGIRMAVGAKPRQIVSLVVRQGMTLVLIGLAAGYAGSIALTGLLKNFLFEVRPTDLPSYAIASTLLLGAGFLACWIPGRRAATIDPQTALRCE